MNRIELVSLIREMVKTELKGLLKSKEGRAIIREVIGSEVRSEVNTLLTEMEQSEAPKEVIKEVRPSGKLSQMVARGELPPKEKTMGKTPIVAFTKNQKLNEMLSQTLNDIRHGNAQLPSSMGVEGQVAMLREQYASNPITAVSSAAPLLPPEERTGKSVVSMLPEKTVEGNPLMINPNALPDHIQKALTRDYRKVMKKVDEKRG